METNKMNIYLKVMKTVALKVKQSDSVSDLKKLFRNQEGIQENLQQVFFSGDRLEDEQKLIDYGIQDDSTLNLYVENSGLIKLLIVVVSKKKTVEIEVKPQDTIEHVKSRVCLKEGILEHRFSLFYAGKKLVDSQTLASVGINGNSNLQLVSTPINILSMYVKLPNDDLVETEVELLSIVADFKEYIASIAGILDSDHSLSYEGTELEDSKTLACYDLKESSLLEIVPRKIQIFVRVWSGKTITLHARLKDTISLVKEEDFRKLSLPPNEYHDLIFGGKRLEDCKDLASLGIKKQSTLQMVFNHRTFLFTTKLSEIADLDKSQRKSTTVFELKKLIEAKWDRPVKYVVFSERVLKDQDSLSVYKIHKESVLGIRFNA